MTITSAALFISANIWLSSGNKDESASLMFGHLVIGLLFMAGAYLALSGEL